MDDLVALNLSVFHFIYSLNKHTFIWLNLAGYLSFTFKIFSLSVTKNPKWIFHTSTICKLMLLVVTVSSPLNPHPSPIRGWLFTDAALNIYMGEVTHASLINKVNLNYIYTNNFFPSTELLQCSTVHHYFLLLYFTAIFYACCSSKFAACWATHFHGQYYTRLDHFYDVYQNCAIVIIYLQLWYLLRVFMWGAFKLVCFWK